MSDYGKQLLEKQRVRYTYGITEKQLVNYVIENAEIVVDTTHVYSILINSYSSQSKFNNAIEIGRKIIGQLGVKLPENPKKSRSGKRIYTNTNCCW